MNKRLQNLAYMEIEEAEYEFDRGRKAIKEYKTDKSATLEIFQQQLIKLKSKLHQISTLPATTIRNIKISILNKKIARTENEIHAIKIGINYIKQLEKENKKPKIHFTSEEEFDADKGYGI